MHWQGAQNFFYGVDQPHKHLFVTPPAHAERPFHEWHEEMIRWYDHWLKGIDNGVDTDPAVKVWIMGENKWRTYDDWPVPETQWTKYYLHSWEKLSAKGHLPATRTFVNEPPDAFVQMPPTQTNRIERLRYMTEPLADDLLIAGPIALTFWASLDEDDTNWIVILKDVGPDVSVQSARPGEREVPAGLPERELTRGWLKASRRALDPDAHQALEALALPQPRDHPAGGAGRDQRVSGGDPVDGQPVQDRAPHLPGDHLPRPGRGRRRRDLRRVHPQPRVLEQDGAAQGVPQRGVPVAPAAAGDTSVGHRVGAGRLAHRPRAIRHVAPASRSPAGALGARHPRRYRIGDLS